MNMNMNNMSELELNLSYSPPTQTQPQPQPQTSSKFIAYKLGPCTHCGSYNVDKMHVTLDGCKTQRCGDCKKDFKGTVPYN